MSRLRPSDAVADTEWSWSARPCFDAWPAVLVMAAITAESTAPCMACLRARHIPRRWAAGNAVFVALALVPGALPAALDCAASARGRGIGARLAKPDADSAHVRPAR
ncbi:hypothetical protein ABT173_27575 [Streptomyces sp. NPDC001795]|uniref:hypothetical protein n=1 Tax=unclassified Streptomyces TaxID=2593676 RepID=UPI00332859ED